MTMAENPKEDETETIKNHVFWVIRTAGNNISDFLFKSYWRLLISRDFGNWLDSIKLLIQILLKAIDVEWV
jgi:hypothetical protein